MYYILSPLPTHDYFTWRALADNCILVLTRSSSTSLCIDWAVLLSTYQDKYNIHTHKIQSYGLYSIN